MGVPADIQIKNPDASDNISTSLSEEYTSGTTLNVDSSTGFANGQYIIVGEPGLENTEVTSLTAAPPSNTTLTISSLKFSHHRGTPVYYCSWDKYSLEYRTVSTDPWAAYGSMPADLTYDALITTYRDAAATSTYSWRYRYYSTEKTIYTDYSDTIGSGGWPKNSVGYMVRQVRKIISDPDSKTVTDTEIIRFFNAAQDKIYSLYDRWWFLFTVGSRIATQASVNQYNLPSDFGRMHSLLFEYINGSTDTTYNLKYLPIIEFDYESGDNNAADDDKLQYYTIYPTQFYVWPQPATAGLYMTPRYYKTISLLDSFADETEVPIPSMLEDYALAEIFKIRAEETKADYYDKIFREQIELLKLMQRKQVGQPRHLWKWQGRNAEDRLFGNTSNTKDVENDF